MSWQSEMVMQLRYNIGDIDSPLAYTDSRLQAMLVIAAGFVIPQFNFSQTFTSDANAMTITPDPTIGPNPDEWFVNFTIFQSCIMITRNELRVASNSAVSFKEFHTSVDMRQLHLAKKVLLKEFQDIYDKMELQYRIGVRPSHAAITTPFNVVGAGWRGGMWIASDRDRLVI